MPDEKYGEELCAWVIARTGAELDEDAVRDFCRGRLAHFKVPRYVIFVDEFPMTITGKVQKFKMREASIERLGLEDAAAVQQRVGARGYSERRRARAPRPGQPVARPGLELGQRGLQLAAHGRQPVGHLDRRAGLDVARDDAAAPRAPSCARRAGGR